MVRILPGRVERATDLIMEILERREGGEEYLFEVIYELGWTDLTSYSPDGGVLLDLTDTQTLALGGVLLVLKKDEE